jgi:hypothetical protein
MVNLADRNRLITRIREMRRDRDNLYKQLNAMDDQYVREFNRLNANKDTRNAAWRLHDEHFRVWDPMKAQAKRLDDLIWEAERDLRRVERGR